jgi:phenylacetate-CoA ligase
MSTPLARASFAAKTRIAQPHLWRADQQLQAAESLGPEQTIANQRQGAIDLARFAFDNTRFYRDRYTDAGLTRSDLSDPDVWDALPIIDKAEVKQRSDDLIVPGLDSALLLKSSTGGSTGVPLTVFHDKRAPVAAMWWRVYRWWGLHPADNRGYIQRDGRSIAQQQRERREWWPTVQLFLNARAMNADSMKEFATDWNTHRPKLLNGYLGGVHEFARFIHDSGMPFVPPLAVGVTAAPVTQSLRSFISSALQAPVYDQYRSSEVPWIAAQCASQSGLHVLSDLRVVDIVDERDAAAPVGQVGEVVVTDLTNRVFPLIRYRLGDRSSQLDSSCSCGLPFGQIAPVEGRVIDMLWLPDGRRISGVALTGLFNARPEAVRQFQIHQRADYSIVVRCVAGIGGGIEGYVGEVAVQLAQIVGLTVPIEIDFVSEIRHDGGKVRAVLSEIPRAPGADVHG